MSHELLRLTESLKNKPHLIESTAFDDLLAYLENRNDGYFEKLSVEAKEFANQTSRERVSVENGNAIIPVQGPLSYKFTAISALCGMSTYQQLESDVAEAISQGAERIALDLDSGGGEAYHTFETAQLIRDMCDENDVYLMTYVDGICGSAAYALASVSDELILNPMAKAGSIGVVVQIVNDLPKEISEGTEVRFVYAGDSKVPYNEDGTIKEDYLGKLQEDVDKLYTNFVDFVADHRPMTESQVMATQAQMFDSQDSVDMGLADRIMTTEEFQQYIEDLSDEVEPMPLFWRKRDNKNPRAEANAEQGSVDLESREQGQESFQETQESPSSQESLETNANEQAQENNESQENSEAEMDLNELLSSDEAMQKLLQSEQVQSKLSEMAEEKAGPLREQLKQYEQEREEKAKAEFTELVKGYSFVSAENQEAVATFLYQHKDSDGVDAVMESLEAARTAIDAAVVDEERGDDGEALEVDDEAREKSAVSEIIKQRYGKNQ